MEGWKLAATILNYGIIISYNCSYGNGHCTATLGRLPGTWYGTGSYLSMLSPSQSLSYR